MHAALRQLDRPLVAMPMIYAVAIAAFLATPVLLQLSSTKSLQKLQRSQSYTTTTQAKNTGPNGNNLALEQVDFSSRSKILTNLPKRIRDIMLRPYPWQLHDASQRFGAIGTLVAYAGLLLLVGYGWRNRGHIFPLSAPLLYPLLFLLVAYSLSAGNAGTGFRYRTHLVTLALAMMTVLREHALRARAGSRTEPIGLPGDAVQRPRELVPALRTTVVDPAESA
jgi:hypothetical protein